VFHSPVVATLARAAALAAFLVVPAELAFADVSPGTPQAGPPPRPGQQTQTLGAAAPSDQGTPRGLQATNGDDPYARTTGRDNSSARRQGQESFSNEPNWMGTEYTGL
jgi:hypothetical protein